MGGIDEFVIERDDAGYERFIVATTFPVYCKYGGSGLEGRPRPSLHRIPRGASAWGPPGTGLEVGGYTLCEACYAEMREAEVRGRAMLAALPLTKP